LGNGYKGKVKSLTCEKLLLKVLLTLPLSCACSCPMGLLFPSAKLGQWQLPAEQGETVDESLANAIVLCI